MVVFSSFPASSRPPIRPCQNGSLTCRSVRYHWPKRRVSANAAAQTAHADRVEHAWKPSRTIDPTLAVCNWRSRGAAEKRGREALSGSAIPPVRHHELPRCVVIDSFLAGSHGATGTDPARELSRTTIRTTLAIDNTHSSVINISSCAARRGMTRLGFLLRRSHGDAGHSRHRFRSMRPSAAGLSRSHRHGSRARSFPLS
jgi:hypothetical protein